MNSVTITRKELYDLAWSQPIVSLARKFGMTDSNFRAVCNRYNIPLPKKGHWMKVQYDKPVQKEPFSERFEGNQIIEFTEGGQENILKGSVALSPKQVKRKEVEETAGDTLRVPDRLSNPDQLVSALKDDLNRKDQYGNKDMVYNSRGHLRTNVSKVNLARTLRIWDTLIKALKNRGHCIKVDDFKTALVVFGQTIKVNFREKLRRVKNQGSKYPSFTDVPTGKLCFKFDEPYSSKEWIDGRELLEFKIPDIITGLELEAEYWNDVQEQHRIEREARIEKERREQELHQIQQHELDKFKSLLQAARRFNECEMLRAYVSTFTQRMERTSDLKEYERIAELKVWAEKKIDWYNPSVELEDKLMSEVDRDKLELIKRSGFYN